MFKSLSSSSELFSAARIILLSCALSRGSVKLKIALLRSIALCIQYRQRWPYPGSDDPLESMCWTFPKALLNVLKVSRGWEKIWRSSHAFFAERWPLFSIHTAISSMEESFVNELTNPSFLYSALPVFHKEVSLSISL